MLYPPVWGDQGEETPLLTGAEQEAVSAYFREHIIGESEDVPSYHGQEQHDLSFDHQAYTESLRDITNYLGGTVYRNLPPADDRSLAWMMSTHPRLGSGTDCQAGSLAGNDLVLDRIRHMGLVPSAIDTQKQSCELLISIVRALALEDQSILIEKIYSAEGHQQHTAEQDVLGHLGVFEMNQDTQETLRHVLYSTEFQERGLIERRRTPYARSMRPVHQEPESTQIQKYIADMIYCVQNFSMSLVSITLPSNASCLLCVVAREHYDDDDEEGETLLTNMKQGDALHAPIVTFDPRNGYSTYGFHTVSLYNLGDQDLSFSCDPIVQSAQLHGGDFLFRGDVDTEVPKHDKNILPGRGFGCLYPFPSCRRESHTEYHIRDVNNKVVLTFVL